MIKLQQQVRVNENKNNVHIEIFSLNPVRGGLDNNCKIKIEEFAALQVDFKKLNKFIPPENSTAPISDETQAGLYQDSFLGSYCMTHTV